MPTPPDAQTNADRAHLRRALVALVDMGLAVASHLHKEILATPVPAQTPAPASETPASETPASETPAGKAPAAEALRTAPRTPSPSLATLAAAFERVARGVRRTVLLIDRLDAERAAPDPAVKSHAARKRLIREVEDAISHANPRPTDAQPLRAELRERIDLPDLEDDIATLPIETVIRNVLHDLGLNARAEYPTGPRPWQRRTPDDIVQLVLDAAPPYLGPTLVPAHPHPS